MGFYAERYLPSVVGLLVFALLWILRDSIGALFLAHKINMDGLYNAVFGWSAIQTGFIFAVYGFVVGSEGNFIEQIRETRPMRLFLRYAKNATFIGFALTFFSMPLMVASFNISANVYIYSAVAAWFSVFIWAFLSFVRVAYLFGLLLRPTAKAPLPG